MPNGKRPASLSRGLRHGVGRAGLRRRPKNFYSPMSRRHGDARPDSCRSLPRHSPAIIRSELVEPEMEAAIIFLRYIPFVAPVRFNERRIGHVSRRTHVGFARSFRPRTTFGRPIAVWEIIEGIVEEFTHVVIGGTGRGIIADGRRWCDGHSTGTDITDHHSAPACYRGRRGRRHSLIAGWRLL